MRVRHGIGFAVFCLLAGSRWLLDAAWPQTLPPLLAQSLPFAVVGMMAAAVIALQDTNQPVSRRSSLQAAAGGLLLLGVPMLLQQFAPAVQPSTSVALYALVPLCVVGIVGFGDDGSRASMVPALAGLSGLLLVLPWRLPSTARESLPFAWVSTAVLLTAVGCVWLHAVTRGQFPMRSVAFIALANALVLGSVAVLRGERMVSFGGGDCAAMIVDVLQLTLLIWLVRGVAPERLAARFFLVPLVTILEGEAVLRAPLDARTAVGLLLTLSGAGALLWRERKSESPLSLR